MLHLFINIAARIGLFSLNKARPSRPGGTVLSFFREKERTKENAPSNAGGLRSLAARLNRLLHVMLGGSCIFSFDDAVCFPEGCS
ncbi:MAG: hypothetical protein BWY96_01924 [Spirochaetes bacterium ADurb.BinA120]|jgi:hypothetical protein|nr:MAG: hypothetical protein BWY96_01924 [Spirochaetes bacterium ADurb.BinA120]